MGKPIPYPHGDITAAEALAALDAMTRNVKTGLLPTTGGAVSLMSRDHVDVIYEANRDEADPFAPILPETGRPAATRGEWYIAAIEQALLFGDTPFRADLVLDMDGRLHGYRGIGVNWQRIHAYAKMRDSTVLPMGNAYWSSDTEPLSVLAFCGEAMRARVTDARLAPLRAASARTANTSAEASNLADRLTKVETAHSQLKRVGSAFLLGMFVLVLVALGTAERWEKIDVPEQPATFRTQKFNTGTFNVTEDRVNPCHVGQGWGECINGMVRQYNRACTGVSLTFYSDRFICGPYGDSIDQMNREAQPGWIVETLGGHGHLTRRPVRDTRRVSNNDARPAITHEAICYLGFIGECPQASD